MRQRQTTMRLVLTKKRLNSGREPPAQAQPEIPHLFALGDTVYARHDLETSDGKPVPTGTRGTITRLYNRNPTHGWSYDVDFDGHRRGLVLRA